MHVSMLVHVPPHTHAEAKGKHQAYSSISLLLLEACLSARLADQQTPGIYPTRAPRDWGCGMSSHAQLLSECKNSKSSPYVYTEVQVLTESSP